MYSSVRMSFVIREVPICHCKVCVVCKRRLMRSSALWMGVEKKGEVLK